MATPYRDPAERASEVPHASTLTRALRPSALAMHARPLPETFGVVPLVLVVALAFLVTAGCTCLALALQ